LLAAATSMPNHDTMMATGDKQSSTSVGNQHQKDFDLKLASFPPLSDLVPTCNECFLLNIICGKGETLPQNLPQANAKISYAEKAKSAVGNSASHQAQSLNKQILLTSENSVNNNGTASDTDSTVTQNTVVAAATSGEQPQQQQKFR